jgi:hypothetical protein
VRDQGWVPADPDRLPLFFARTGQWERYDAVDPDGEALYRWYAQSRASLDWARGSEADAVAAQAREHGRPDPAARWREENPPPPVPEGTERRRGYDGPTGAWHGSYGSPGGFHT